MLRKALTVAAFCLAAGCSDQGGNGRQPGAQQDPYIPRPVVETTHYRIHSSATDTQTRAVGESVESLYAAYAKVFGQQRQVQRLELVLYKSQAEFKANNRSAAWAEAYYREPRSYAYPGNGDNPHHWMLHEATHQLLRQASGFKLRRWVNEGIASYFGAGTLRDGMLDPMVADAAAYPIWWLASLELSGDMQADIDRGVVIPIEQIVEDTGPPISQDVNGYYLHYWSLTHYLLDGDAGKHRDAFLALVRQGGGPVEFRRLLGPYAQIQRGWYEHLRALAMKQRQATKNGSE
ncbi:DUF1570 domain-containing protein [Thermomonas sp. HDW16]|uniref:DUF1570 domain-containing protein n=1 Tax=Thermomonas sp. HDW16 TaxID=2714945 RepID=UPI00140B0658|nr:DUF1570 domain-containing protein [Thermomonas sp. HDW16]QIL21312.1 DUF1570 domain-containing protein [Thermomonas sp. HDW16]